jgi:uncharacterized protein (TIGR03118 family)
MLRIHSSYDFVKMACMIALVSAPGLLLADEYSQINLVSDIPGLANKTDPNLLDPWGVSFSTTSPFWVSNQASGTSTLYDGAGNKIPLTVTTRNLGDAPSSINNGPTGQVFNIGGSTNFLVGGTGTGANFIFANLDGSISAWNGGAGTTAEIEASTAGASYTGLAIATVSGSTFIYAADQNGSGIHIFNSSWQDIGVFGSDPNLPSGYTPFNVQTIGSVLYVTYGNQSSTSAGNGVVDEFDTKGNFIKRVATGGALNLPWAVTIAPSGFGAYSNDLLIGNNGNGEILAYNPITDAYLGTLDGTNGQPIIDDNLWALETRTGGSNVNLDALYFAAGINNGADGLFGEIVLTPEPATIFETTAALLLMVLFRIRRRGRLS